MHVFLEYLLFCLIWILLGGEIVMVLVFVGITMVILVTMVGELVLVGVEVAGVVSVAVVFSFVGAA